ncbi:MAG: radical SAM protein [bacterium]|nr:radical SAM protein [bacterium]
MRMKNIPNMTKREGNIQNNQKANSYQFNKKKVVLIMPPIRLEDRYGKIAKVGNTMASLGLAYLGAYIRKYEYTPYIIESPALNLEFNDILNQILMINPDYVGISSSTMTIYNAAKIAEMIKESKPEIKIIIGGAHITATPDKTMKQFKYFDIGVIGEGEITFKELLNVLDKGDDISKVKGIVFRDKNGEIKVNERREYIEDLDLLPFPAWDIIHGFPSVYKLSAPLSIHSVEASIITSRGCPYNCIFCDRSVFGRKYRYHSAEYVLEMFRILTKEYYVKHVYIYDDTFTTAKERLYKICNYLIKEKTRISWTCQSTVHIDYETLKLMKTAGCWQVGFGIESGSERILKVLKKSQTIEQVKKAVWLAHKVGLKIRGLFIIGSPTETREDIMKSIALSKELPLDDLQMLNFTPFPGTEIYTLAKEYGEFEDNWRKMNFLEPIFIPYGLTKEELIKYQNRAHIEFYLRFKVVWKYIMLTIKHPVVFINIYKGATVLSNIMINTISNSFWKKEFKRK